MLCLATAKLPEGVRWQYELKVDGYRALAFKSRGKPQLRSRNNKDFATRYRTVVDALRDLPDETLIDGEVVAFDDSGHPSFNLLQNFGLSNVPIFYYAFDLLVFAGTDIRSEPLEARRELLRTDILPKLSEPHSLFARTGGQLG
jgi:bifunctional non-homologous end joining protein LigD